MEADEKGMDQLSMNFYGDCSIYSTDIQFQVFVAALLKISKETGKERLLVSVFELKQFANILGETFAEKKEQINNQIEIDRLSNLPEHMMLLQIKKVLGGRSLKEAVDDQRLSLCWKGRKPFKSIHDAKKYFKPLALSFTSGKTKILNELTPEAYLIISSKGNVCLGILNESEVGLQDLNLIGDILMQDRMVIYDNDKKLIRWIPANCDRPPKSKTMYM